LQSEHPHARIVPGVAAGDGEAVVVGPIIDDDQLEVGERLAENRLDRLRQERRAVQNRQDDRDGGQLGRPA
jgi:hypothetical protein